MPEKKIIINESASSKYLQLFAGSLAEMLEREEETLGRRNSSPLTESLGASSNTETLSTSIDEERENPDKYELIDISAYSNPRYSNDEEFKREFLDKLSFELASFSEQESIPIIKAFNYLFLYADSLVTGEESALNAEEVYTELMLALDNPRIAITAKTPLLGSIYKRLFLNNLDLINQIRSKLQYDTESTQSTYKSYNLREKMKKILGERTWGIYTPEGKAKVILSYNHPESLYSRVAHGVLGFDYNPLAYNNLPYIYPYKYQGNENTPLRLRIGAPIVQQRNRPLMTLDTRVAQTFKNYLYAIGSYNSNKCNHLYINLMKTKDQHTHKRSWLPSKSTVAPSERDYEALRSEAIHDLEQELTGFVVITLPADNGYFTHLFDKHHGGSIVLAQNYEGDFVKLDDIFGGILASIVENKNDVYMSERTKQKLFDSLNKDDIAAKIKPIFDQAVNAILGNRPITTVSNGQRQAILFQFYKHNFTQFLLQALNPQCFNISCKDAIDRGGVHNLWNIFCSTIENNKSMSLEEFETLLTIPAVLVKERPINDHMYLVVNCLGYYYSNLPPEKRQLIPWVEEWLKINSVYRDEAAAAYNWRYEDRTSIVSFRKLNNNLALNPLYIAVVEDDLDAVNKALLEPNTSIWDSAAQTDTILRCAAANAQTDIFLRLIEFYDANQGKQLSGLRSQLPHGIRGSPLNILLKHLCEDQVENSECLVNCVIAYIRSIVSNPSTTIPYFKYTSSSDDTNKTPLCYLAISGDVDILGRINAEFDRMNNTNSLWTNFFSNIAPRKIWTVIDFKNSGQDGKSLIDVAADYGNMDFINEIARITNTNVYTQDEIDTALKKAMSFTKKLAT